MYAVFPPPSRIDGARRLPNMGPSRRDSAAISKNLLKELHEAHSGVVRMKALARSIIWWPGLDDDIESIARSCPACAEIANKPAEAPLHTWDLPSAPWQRVHLDFAGPFFGHMWLIYVDAYSKWAGVVQMRTTRADDLIDILRPIISTFGLPEQLVSDNGPQFVSRSLRHTAA